MSEPQSTIQDRRPHRAMKRLYIQTYGCQMNQYDSERIARVLGRVDYVATESIENADLILLNTCSVRDKAEQKVYSSLGRWKELKEQREGVVIGVGGCLAQQEGEREVSRPSEKIIAEVECLVRQGVKEVMLLGQNVNSYGKTSPGEINFAELLCRVNAIPGLERIRFTTSHPQDLSPELIEAFATLERLCEHLHLPVQSGSDSVLARMRRGYNCKEYLHRIRLLNDRCPEVALSTDIIVGFPGETDDEFQSTLELLRQVEYDEIFSFMYSPRRQTVSTKLYDDDVPKEIKKDRLKKVQSLQR